MKFTKILSLLAGLACFSWLTFLSLWLPHFQQPALVALKATIWFFPAFTVVASIMGNCMWYSFKYAIKVDSVKTEKIPITKIPNNIPVNTPSKTQNEISIGQI